MAWAPPAPVERSVSPVLGRMVQERMVQERMVQEV
jgi:hypothetical protein